MPTYSPITDGEIAPNQPLTTGLAFRFRDNPVAIAERSAGAPWLNGIGALETFDTPGTYTWTVPVGVYRAEFVIAGGGQAGDNSLSTGASGGNSSVSGVGTAQGGAPIFSSVNGITAGNGGRGTTGMPGKPGELKTFVVNVTPAATYTVTIGAGGTALGFAESGGNGIVYIRY